MVKLIVETGVGLESANAYVSVREVRNFSERNGISLPDDDDDLAILVVKATNYIDSLESQFVGKRLLPEQNLAFPRILGRSCDNSSVRLADMRNLKKAVFYAIEVLALGNNLMPTMVSRDDIVTKEKIDGAIEVTYSDSNMKYVLLPQFPMIARYLADYLQQSSGQVRVGR